MFLAGSPEDRYNTSRPHRAAETHTALPASSTPAQVDRVSLLRLSSGVTVLQVLEILEGCSWSLEQQLPRALSGDLNTWTGKCLC